MGDQLADKEKKEAEKEAREKARENASSQVVMLVSDESNSTVSGWRERLAVERKREKEQLVAERTREKEQLAAERRREKDQLADEEKKEAEEEAREKAHENASSQVVMLVSDESNSTASGWRERLAVERKQEKEQLVAERTREK